MDGAVAAPSAWLMECNYERDFLIRSALISRLSGGPSQQKRVKNDACPAGNRTGCTWRLASQMKGQKSAVNTKVAAIQQG